MRQGTSDLGAIFIASGVLSIVGDRGHANMPLLVLSVVTRRS